MTTLDDSVTQKLYFRAGAREPEAGCWELHARDSTRPSPGRSEGTSPGAARPRQRMHYGPGLTPTTFRVRRLFGWLPAFSFLVLLAFAQLGARSLREGLALMPLTLIVAIWFWRCRRLSVQTTEEGVIVRTSALTHRYRWSELVEAKLVSMPTASPWARRWPYVALGLELRDGRVRKFSDISAAVARKAEISAIVDHINEHIGPESGA